MTCIDNCYGDEKEDLISFIFELLLDKSLLANSRRSGSKSLIKAKGNGLLINIFPACGGVSVFFP